MEDWGSRREPDFWPAEPEDDIQFSGSVEDAVASIRAQDENVLKSVMFLGRKLRGKVPLSVEDLENVLKLCGSEDPLGRESRILVKNAIEAHPHAAEALASHDFEQILRLMQMRFDKELRSLLSVIFRSSPKIGESLPQDFFVSWVRQCTETIEEEDLFYRLATLKNWAIECSESQLILDAIAYVCTHFGNKIADLSRNMFGIVLELLATYVSLEKEENKVSELARQLEEEGGFQAIFSRFSPGDATLGSVMLLLCVQLSAQGEETWQILLRCNIEHLIEVHYQSMVDEDLKRYSVEILRNFYVRQPERQLNFLSSSLAGLIFQDMESSGSFQLKKSVIHFLSGFRKGTEKFIEYFIQFNLIDVFFEVFQNTTSETIRIEILNCLLHCASFAERKNITEAARCFFLHFCDNYEEMSVIAEETENEDLLKAIEACKSFIETAENSGLYV